MVGNPGDEFAHVSWSGHDRILPAESDNAYGDVRLRFRRYTQMDVKAEIDSSIREPGTLPADRRSRFKQYDRTAGINSIDVAFPSPSVASQVITGFDPKKLPVSPSTIHQCVQFDKRRKEEADEVRSVPC